MMLGPSGRMHAYYSGAAARMLRMHGMLRRSCRPMKLIGNPEANHQKQLPAPPCKASGVFKASRIRLSNVLPMAPSPSLRAPMALPEGSLQTNINTILAVNASGRSQQQMYGADLQQI